LARRLNLNFTIRVNKQIKTRIKLMKNLLALLAIVLAFTVTSASAQTTTKEKKNKVKTEQTASKETATAGKSCCASHGAKAEAKDDAAGVKTASTTHEHGGAMCDPKNCTEAQKKQCAGAKGKGCCMGSAAATETKTEDKLQQSAPRP
jgi:hypothetical protein